MSPSAVLYADKPRDSSVVAGIATITGRGKCIPPSVPLVAKKHRCLLSLDRTALFTAANVTLKFGPRIALKKVKRKEGTNNAIISFLD